MKLDARLQSMIWAHHQAAPPDAVSYPQWCDQAAEQFNVKPTDIRRVVTRMSLRETTLLKQNSMTVAQQTAMLRGVDQLTVIETLLRSMRAKVSKPILRRRYDSEGSTVEDFVETLEFEDYGTQVKAAQAMADILGMSAPKQVSVESHHTHEHDFSSLSLEELKSRISENQDAIRALIAPTTGEKASGTGSSKAASAGAAVQNGPVRMADGSDKDKGRAGRKKRAAAVPPVPEEPLHPASDKCFRQGAEVSGVRAEEPHNDGNVDDGRLDGVEDIHATGDNGSSDVDGLPSRTEGS